MREIVQDAARQAAQEAVQQIAREEAREAAQEAARVAAQKVARQMAAVQQGPQVQVQQGPQIRVLQVPPVQDQQIPVQHDHQVPVQQVPLPQVLLQEGPAQQFAHGAQDLPPPPQRPQVYPVYDERFYRLTCQMRNMDMEHFSGTVDVVAAHDWNPIAEEETSPGYRLVPVVVADIVGSVLAPAAPAVAQVCFGCNQPGQFIRDCPRRGNAALPPPPKRLAIAPLTYHILGELVEKAAEQEAGLEEEQKLAKAVHVKSGKAPESHSRGGDQSGLPTCPRCRRRHSGKCPTYRLQHQQYQQWHKFALAVISQVNSSEIVREGAMRHFHHHRSV
ncbi:hypothetical protein F2Q69_00052374 [Brassica cretica]|uniref:CCHC-type domain-containing protein n=1 Tax=Brassica cretica TaxID=69181 RepID=A0A8S9N480_BRACR|nr:hypothetical protein F2Q69_00052374 [Brassica cretica]